MTAEAQPDGVPAAADARGAGTSFGVATPRVHPIQLVERIAWFACVATLAVWSITYIAWPFSNDQGNLAWVGSVVLGGGMPYRDAWDVKGPAAHLLFAIPQLVFGRNEWGLRVFDLAMLALGAVALYRIVTTYAARGAARWAVVLYLLWYASLNHHNTAQPDGWAAVLLTVAVRLLVVRVEPSPSLAAAASALIAVCALVKPTYALFLALPLGVAVRSPKPWRAGPMIRVGIASMLGFVVPLALCVGWFYARGALDDWAAVHLEWIPSSYAQIDTAWLNRIQYLATFLTGAQFAPTVAVAVGGLYIVRRQTATDALLLFLWLAIALFGVLVQGQFYPYHWHPAYPPLAALAGLGLHALWTWVADTTTLVHGAGDDAPTGRDDTRVALAVGAALSAIVVAGAAIEPALHDYRFAKSLVAPSGAADYDRVEFGPFGHRAGVFPQLVAYLRAHSSPDDTVLVWGSAAGINYLSGRSAVTPFGFIQPLVDPPDTPIRRQYRAAFMTRLTSTPPRYIVALSDAICARSPSTEERQLMGKAEGLIRCLTDLPAVQELVRTQYVSAVTLGPLVVWRRR